VGRRYFFRTEPSLVKVVRDEANAVPLHHARAEVERRIKQVWRDAGLKVEPFPGEPADLEDQPKGRLVVHHWDTATFKAGDKSAPEKVRELWEYAGQQRGYRRFRNTLFFLREQRRRLDGWRKEADLELRVAITRAYPTSSTRWARWTPPISPWPMRGFRWRTRVTPESTTPRPSCAGFGTSTRSRPPMMPPWPRPW